MSLSIDSIACPFKHWLIMLLNFDIVFQLQLLAYISSCTHTLSFLRDIFLSISFVLMLTSSSIWTRDPALYSFFCIQVFPPLINFYSGLSIPYMILSKLVFLFSLLFVLFSYVFYKFPCFVFFRYTHLSLYISYLISYFFGIYGSPVFVFFF